MLRVIRPRLSKDLLLWGASLAVVAGFCLLALPSVPGLASPARHAQAHLAPDYLVCSCSPAAVFIPTTSPGGTLSVGDRVTVSVQFAVVRWSANFTGVAIHLPNTFGNLPLATSGYFPVTIPARNLTIAGPGWSNESLANVTKVVTTNTSLSSSNPAYLSTQRIAVMANVPHGTLKLSFHWRWMVQHNGTNTTTLGAWSSLGLVSGTKSTIMPAPWVWLLPTTVKTLALGGTFTARLQGLVANQGTWLFEMEYPTSGDVVLFMRLPGLNGSATFWNASIPMVSGEGVIPPGAMLVHIHDGYGNIIWSISVHLYTPPTTTVTFVITPSSCATTISLNGTAYANGTSGTLPTAGGYPLRAGYCKGLFFHSWSDLGGGASFGSVRHGVTNATLFYNATIIATYG